MTETGRRRLEESHSDDGPPQDRRQSATGKTRGHTWHIGEDIGARGCGGLGDAAGGGSKVGKLRAGFGWTFVARATACIVWADVSDGSERRISANKP